MSQLTYNGVTFGPYGLNTQRVSFEPVYDPSGVDYLYTRVTIAVQAVISNPLVPATGVETPSDTMVRVQHLLQVPRRGLLFTVAGVTLVSVGAGSVVPTMDAKYGPMPGPCTITRIQGDKAFIVTYSVTAHVVDCVGASAPAYLSHRWSETIDIDRFALTKRTRVGTIITRSDMNVSPDAFRGIIAPALEPDFIRVDSSYNLSPDGLTLTYTFVDEEQQLMPPAPSAECDMSYIESTQEGAIRYGEAHVMIRGAKTTDRGVLLRLALSMALAKLEAADPVRQNADPLAASPIDAPGVGRINAISGPPMLAFAAIREQPFENRYDVRIRAQLLPLTKTFGRINTDLNRFTSLPLGTGPGVVEPFDPGTRGTAGLSMAAAALQDPCLRQTISQFTNQTPNEANLHGNTVPARVSISAVQPTDLNAKRSDDAGFWARYKVDTRDVTDDHVLQIPVGKTGQLPAIVRTAGATGRRVVEWSVEKVGDVPRVPNPIPTANSNAVLVERHINPGHVEVMPDGVSLKYQASGRYEYVFKDSSLVRLSASVPPWVSPDVIYKVGLKSMEFVDGIIDLNANGFGAGGSVNLTPTSSVTIVPGQPNLENG